jgi:3,4-dihydroxy-2-butanone 4-phosphate synthase
MPGVTEADIENPELSDLERAHLICRLMEDRMRAMGVITTAHYETGIPLMTLAFAAVRKQRDDLWVAIAEVDRKSND